MAALLKLWGNLQTRLALKHHKTHWGSFLRRDDQDDGICSCLLGLGAWGLGLRRLRGLPTCDEPRIPVLQIATIMLASTIRVRGSTSETLVHFPRLRSKDLWA